MILLSLLDDHDVGCGELCCGGIGRLDESVSEIELIQAINISGLLMRTHGYRRRFVDDNQSVIKHRRNMRIMFILTVDYLNWFGRHGGFMAMNQMLDNVGVSQFIAQRYGVTVYCDRSHFYCLFLGVCQYSY